MVNLVKRHSVEELVAKLRSGKTISKDQVIYESNVFRLYPTGRSLTFLSVVAKAQDSDVEATGANVSLKCPLSTLRIEIPCRSTVCMHNQCFDATSFLQLQEQAPTWTCPVCNKTVKYDALEIDLFVVSRVLSPRLSFNLFAVGTSMIYSGPPRNPSIR